MDALHAEIALRWFVARGSRGGDEDEADQHAEGVLEEAQAEYVETADASIDV